MRFIPEWLLPGGGFRRDAREARRKAETARDAPFRQVEREVVRAMSLQMHARPTLTPWQAAGTAPPSFVSNLLNAAGASDVDADADVGAERDLIRACAGTIYFGAFSSRLSIAVPDLYHSRDRSCASPPLPLLSCPNAADADVDPPQIAISLNAFVLAMVTNPAVQARAHAELDAALGRDRLPDFGDADALPYVSAIVKEVMRWNPPAPLGGWFVFVFPPPHTPRCSLALGFPRVLPPPLNCFANRPAQQSRMSPSPPTPLRATTSPPSR